jgi:multicomponent Na+:H+ antiporter subunit A
MSTLAAPDVAALLAAVGLPFLAAGLVPLGYRLLGERVAYAGALVAAVSLGLVASQYGTQGVASVEWIPTLGVALRFYVDGLSLLVALLASGIGVLIFTYAGGYMHGEPAQPRFYASLLAFMGSMLGLVLAADLVALFVFWELTSVTSFLLIGHYSDQTGSQYAARKSMLITVAGGLFLLVGVIALYAVSGQALGQSTFDLVAMLERPEAMRTALREEGLFLPVLALFGVGAGAKSAQVPLHVWLPDAMEAPTPVSAFLHSATMVKAGVYLFGRTRPLFASPEWELALVTLGLATMTVGAVLAVAAEDIKALLAYSTASHLGLIVAGFGFVTGENLKIGGETGAFHVLNHALFKATLFLVAGIVAHEAGSRMLSELGGLRRDLPLTAVVAGVASLSMAGLPPFNGFYSKELLFEAAYVFAAAEGGLAWLAPAVAVFASTFTVLYSARFLLLFLGDQPAALGERHVHRPPVPMLVGPVLLAGLALAVGLVPTLATEGLAGRAAEASFLLPTDELEGGFSIGIPTKLKPAVVMSAIAVVGGGLMIPVRTRIRDAVRAVLARDPATVDFYYDTAVDGLTRVSAAVVGVVQTGLLRTYATWIVGGFAVLALLGHAALGPAVPVEVGAGVTLATVFVLALAVVAAVAVTRAPSHVAGVLTLSIVGFMIAIFYILAAAPDLALTQLLVETLLLIIFLLVLDRLPAFYGSVDRREALRDGALSVLVGAAVFVTVIAATATAPTSPGRFGLRRSLLDCAGFTCSVTGVTEEAGFTVGAGGGANVVNVILVDFRAFDTLGEVAVVAMAALSVVTLLRMRDAGFGTSGDTSEIATAADGGQPAAEETDADADADPATTDGGGDR